MKLVTHPVLAFTPSHNKLLELSEQVGQLQQLKTLVLRANGLDKLPEAIADVSCVPYVRDMIIFIVVLPLQMQANNTWWRGCCIGDNDSSHFLYASLTVL